MARRVLPTLALVLASSPAAWPQAAGCCTLQVIVRDAQGQPLPGARLEVSSGEGLPVSSETDASGRAVIPMPLPGSYLVSATQEGYQPLRQELDIRAGETLDVEFVLTPLRAKESITIEAEAPAVEQASSTAGPVTAEQLKWLPTDPGNVKDALPVIPGILRTPEGRLRISGGAEHRSSLLVNGLDVTDPATGNFGATVPIDSVATLNVYKSPFLAEYGRFTSGVVAV
ncbi:MAG: carboxypeptidase regulatory-like domain-containing protein, partial [Bryobacteraceae bacterium]